MGVQLSLKAALPLAGILATAPDHCSKTGPRASAAMIWIYWPYTTSVDRTKIVRYIFWQGYNLLDNLGGTVQINETLVDAHLEAIPGLGALTTRGLAGGDTQNLGGHAHWATHLQLLLSGSTDQVSTDWNPTARNESNLSIWNCNKTGIKLIFSTIQANKCLFGN